MYIPCSLCLTPSTSYLLFTNSSFLSGPIKDPIDIATSLKFYEKTLKQYGNIRYCIIVESLNGVLVEYILKLAKDLQMRVDRIVDESDAVLKYLCSNGFITSITMVVKVSQTITVKCLGGTVEIGKRIESVTVSTDKLFLDYISKVYPSTSKVLATTRGHNELLVGFKRLKEAFENGNQFVTGGYRIAAPPSMNGLFKVVDPN
jgi:hypothetical protein